MSRPAFQAAWVFVGLGLWFGAEVHATSPWCEVLLAPEKVTRPGTDDTTGFISYLGQLLDAQIISVNALARMEAELERGILVNPISERDALVSSRLLVHYDGLRVQIEQSPMDHARVRVWLHAKLREREHVQVRRQETREETKSPYRQMEFHRIAPGKFKMGEAGNFVDMELVDPFDLMSTLVTQRHWSMIMGENPSRFKDGDQSITMMIQGHAIRMRPDHPVEKVSWDKVQEFIQKLDSLSEARDPVVVRLIPDHRDGDVYRLPTDAEWEFVVKNRGRSNGRFHFGDSAEDLSEYAWFNWQVQETQPVAELRPLLVDGAAFYDLHGNVGEWVEDYAGDHVMAEGGRHDASNRIVRGGSFVCSEMHCRSAGRSSNPQASTTGGIGFRLARVVKR